MLREKGKERKEKKRKRSRMDLFRLLNVNELAVALSKMNMFPYFDAAHYIVSVMSLREQPGKKTHEKSKFVFIHTQNTSPTTESSSPLSSGCSVLMGLSSSCNLTRVYTLHFHLFIFFINASFLCTEQRGVYTLHVTLFLFFFINASFLFTEQCRLE